MDDEARVTHYIEMWKQTITVQQHFNDIEWRIRGLALTALTFALGAAAVAAEEHTKVIIFGIGFQLSATVLVLSMFLWSAFYFVDMHWYHRLLIGSVKHGEALEVELRKHLPAAGLTHQISASSPSPLAPAWVPRTITKLKLGRILKISFDKPYGSSTKLGIFYAIGAAAQIIPAVAFQLSG